MKENGLIARLATYDDIDAIAEITTEAFLKYSRLTGVDDLAALSETKEDIRRDINTKLVFMAYLDGMPVGSVRIEVNEQDKTAYLSRFGVRMNVQNNGVGKFLMNAVDEKMREMGIKKIFLHTASKVRELVQFYYGRGFYIDSTTKDRGYIRALMCKEYDYTS